MNTGTKVAIIAVALRKLFNTQKHFCVCDFDKILELAGVAVTRAERAPFAALHCVDYVDMPHGLKEQLAREMVAILQRPPDFKLEFTVCSVQAPPLLISSQLISQ